MRVVVAAGVRRGVRLRAQRRTQRRLGDHAQGRGGTVYSYYVPDAALRMVTEASLRAALGAEAYAAAYSRGHDDPHALLG